MLIMVIMLILAAAAWVYYQSYGITDFRQMSGIVSRFAKRFCPPEKGKDAWEVDSDGRPRLKQEYKPTQAEAIVFGSACLGVAIIIGAMSIGLYVVFSAFIEALAMHGDTSLFSFTIG